MASAVFGLTQSNNSKVAVVRALRGGGTVQVGEKKFSIDDINASLRKFNEFWELMETIEKHGYLRAAMSVVGKTTVGAWWSLRRHYEYGDKATERQRRRLFDFYTYRNRNWDNIKDWQNLAGKLLIGAMYLRYFGQVGYQILKDGEGRAVGLDHLPGLVYPNVDDKGFFKPNEPAFYQFPEANPKSKVAFDNPRDIIYITNPDMRGSPVGGTDMEALTAFPLPIDIYLQLAAREYMKNRDKPEVVYSLPQDISDEAFDEFVAEMAARHSGAANVGRSPIAVTGDFDIKELRPLPDSLPYQDSRKQAREEILAISGVSGAKLGVSEQLASANLREMRREFHETSMVPLFKMIELALYEQVHLREFQAPGWEFRFNSPDFLNAVEKATVHMRYIQSGVLSPNEARYDLGKEPREGGDVFVEVATEEEEQPIPESQGSPPEGRPIEPDDPSQVGEPNTDDADPERGDQHDETPRNSILRELKQWKAFATKRMKKGKRLREFNPVHIPQDMARILQNYVLTAESVDALEEYFDTAIEMVEEQ